MDRKYLDAPLEIKEVSETGIFEAWGSTFGGEKDSHGDVIVFGAFARSLEAGGRNGTGVAMLWSHKSDSPCGVWKSLIETKKGLKVTGQLAMKTPEGRKVYELLKIGAVKHLSIGYEPVDWENDSKKKIRYLKEVSLWEISLCVFPSNRNATIIGVKECKSIGDLTDALRNLGLSESDALFVPGLCKSCKRLGGLPSSQVKGIAEYLKSYPKDTVADVVLTCESYTCGQDKGSEIDWNVVTESVSNLVKEASLMDKEARKNMEELTAKVRERVEVGDFDFTEVFKVIEKTNLKLNRMKDVSDLIMPEFLEKMSDVGLRLDHVEGRLRKRFVTIPLDEEEEKENVIPKRETVLTSYEKWGTHNEPYKPLDLDHIGGGGGRSGISSFGSI